MFFAMLLAVCAARSATLPPDVRLGPGIFTVREMGRELGIPDGRLKIDRELAHRRFAVFLPQSSWPDLTAKLGLAFGIRTTLEPGDKIHVFLDPAEHAREQRIRGWILDSIATAFDGQWKELGANRPSNWDQAEAERQQLAAEVITPERFSALTEAEVLRQSGDPKWDHWVALTRMHSLTEWLASFARTDHFERLIQHKAVVFDSGSADAALRQFGLTQTNMVPQCSLFRDEPISSLSVGVAYSFDWRTLSLICEPTVYSQADWDRLDAASISLTPLWTSQLDKALSSLAPNLAGQRNGSAEVKETITLSKGRHGQAEAELRWAEAAGQALLAEYSLTTDRESAINCSTDSPRLSLRQILSVTDPEIQHPMTQADRRWNLIGLIMRPERTATTKAIVNRLFRESDVTALGDCLVIRRAAMPLVQWLDPDPEAVFVANGSSDRSIKSPWLTDLPSIRAFARKFAISEIGEWSPLYADPVSDDRDAVSGVLPALPWLRLIEEAPSSQASRLWNEAVIAGEAITPLSQLASPERFAQALDESTAASVGGTFGYSHCWQNGLVDFDLAIRISKALDGLGRTLEVIVRNRTKPTQGVRYQIRCD